MTTTPRLWKPQTQVNTTDAAADAGGSSSQLDGQVTSLSNGGYVVVWTDSSHTYNASGSAIVAQRYDAAGNKVGGNPLHGGEVKISPFSTGTQSAPAIATLANGNVAVAFVDFVTRNDIFVRVFDSSLNAVRADGYIDLPTASQSVDPSLTALADGSYVVSYTVDNGGGDKDIVAKIVSPTGSVGAPIVVMDNGTLDTDFSELATLSNNNFVDVWQRNVAGSHDIYFDIFTSAGVRVTSAAPVTGATSSEETDPDVAALAGGGFVVVWTENTGALFGTVSIHATIMSNTGADVAADLSVNTTRHGAHDANVVGLRDGGFLVTWEEATLRAQRFDALGHKIGAEFTVKNGTSPDSPEAAVLADGRIA